jgi:type I restriction enzyme S subunit
MTLETFFEKFDLFADAPDAVAKMRELVLDLAVQGKVAEQDSSEEPAAELLKRLIAFKLANPLSGRRGRSKEEPVEVEASSDGLPANWVNTTIGEVLYVIRGASPRPKGDPQYFSETRTPYHWVKISDIRKHGQNGLLMDTDEFLTEAGMRKSVLLPKGTLVLTNSATIGVPIVLGIEGCCIHDGYLAFPNFPHDLLSQKFLLYLFHTLKKHAERNARGLAQLNLNTDLVRSFPFGLPPLAEQKRIVAKVDELMALCDRLEAQQQEREEQASQLTRASLARFADAPTPANLEYLFLSSFIIPPSDLRKSILTLAVQGKLVPQDPNDEPADVTFPKLASLAVETEGDDFPAHWLRVPLGKMGEWRGGGTPSKSRPEFWKGDLPWVSPKDMKVLNIADAQDHISPAAVEGSSVRLIPPGSLLMVVRGMILARAFPVALTMREVTINQDMKALLPTEPKTKEYLLVVLRAFEPDVLAAIEHSSHGTCKLKTELLQDFVMPVPPLAEQRRIVAKVEQLMALVDALETQLAASRATAANLLSALVAELTSA